MYTEIKQRGWRGLRLRIRVEAMLGLGVLLLSSAQLNAQTQSPQALFAQAVAAQQRGDAKMAMAIYRSLLRSHPEALVVHANLAGLLADSGNFTEAIQQYQAALRLAPANKDLQLGLAYAYGRRGQPADLNAAVRTLEALHQRDPAEEQTAMLLGDAYFRQGRYSDVVALLQPLERAHAEDWDLAWMLGASLVRSGHPGEGVDRLDKVASHTGDVDALLLAGEARLALQQFDVARRDAEAALGKDPHLPAAQILLGRVLEHAGDYSAAERALREGVAKQPDDFNAQYYLGALLLFQRDLPEAETHLRRALQLQPASAEARYKLALVEQGQGQTDRALDNLHEVVKARPAWVEPQAKLLAMLYSLHRTAEADTIKAQMDRLMADEQKAIPASAP